MVLLFDLDDTLVPSTQAYGEAMRGIGISADDPAFLQARQEVKESLPKNHPAARSRRNYFRRYLEIKSSYTPDRHERLSAEYEARVIEFLSQAWAQLGRSELFAELKAASRAIGIISNEMTAFQKAKLSKFDPDGRYFDFLVTSEEAGVEKPDPRIFEIALNKSRAKPQECLFVGDNPQLDLDPAEHLGMHAVQTIEFLRNPPLHDQRLNQLSELPKYLRKLNK